MYSLSYNKIESGKQTALLVLTTLLYLSLSTNILHDNATVTHFYFIIRLCLYYF